MYKTLNIDKISETLDALCRRIGERFPESGLLNVATELRSVATDIGVSNEFIRRPQPMLRVAVGIVILLAVVVLVAAFNQIQVTTPRFQLSDLIEMTDAALNVTVVAGAALYFLVTVETKLKRNRALDGLHQLRSIAHVIDMHQLTKDPSVILGGDRTPSSPVREMTPFQLCRYLDYCSELMSLTAKLAAVYGQSIQDREVLAAVADVESLTTDLSRKIWQKVNALSGSGRG